MTRHLSEWHHTYTYPTSSAANLWTAQATLCKVLACLKAADFDPSVMTTAAGLVSRHAQAQAGLQVLPPAP